MTPCIMIARIYIIRNNIGVTDGDSHIFRQNSAARSVAAGGSYREADNIAGGDEHIA